MLESLSQEGSFSPGNRYAWRLLAIGESLAPGLGPHYHAEYSQPTWCPNSRGFHCIA